MSPRFWFALKALVTVGLLLVVLTQVQLGRLPLILAQIGWGATAVALALTFVSVLVATWRWHRVLRHLGERVAPQALLADTLMGTAYNLILPTSVGGDVARAYRCGQRVQQSDRAWASVVTNASWGCFHWYWFPASVCCSPSLTTGGKS
jgi:uncharacterized protein (TIRG00374 family)